jgi:hypothetical protein
MKDTKARRALPELQEHKVTADTKARRALQELQEHKVTADTKARRALQELQEHKVTADTKARKGYLKIVPIIVSVSASVIVPIVCVVVVK